MPEIIIKNPNVIDPNAELERAGIPQDLVFGGQNTLLKQDLITRRGQKERLKYFKLIVDDKPFAGFTLEGYPFPRNAIGIDVIEYYGICYGREKLLKMLNTYRDKKKMAFMMELEAIRNAQEIEKKILKRD
jgi:hypothetical protein